MFILLRTLLACSKKNNPHFAGEGGVAVVPIFFGVVVLLKKKIFKSSKDFLYSFVIWLKKKKSLSILRVVKKKNFMSKVVERLGRNKLNQFLNRADDKKIYCLFFNFFKAEISNSAPINTKAPIKLVAKKIKWFLKKVTWLGGKNLVFSRLGWKRATSLGYPLLKKKKLFEVFKKLVCFSGGLLNTEKNIIFNIGDALATNLGKSKFMPKTWAAVKMFRLNMQTQLSLIFNHNIELNLFLQNSIFSLRKPALFLLSSRRLMSRVFIKRKEKPLLKYVFFIYFLSLFFRAPQCAANIIAEALEFSRFHYGFLGPFRKLAALLNLKEFGLLGARIGLFGRLNGRDRKFKYYVNFGSVPALRTLDLKVVYARAQSVPRYGAVHVHIWYYYY